MHVDFSGLNWDQVWEAYDALQNRIENDPNVYRLTAEEILNALPAGGMRNTTPSEPWRSTTASRPLNKMGHASKHLKDFQKLDPKLTEGDVAKILDHVRSVGKATPTSFGGKAFEAVVEIGGKSVTVKVIERLERS